FSTVLALCTNLKIINVGLIYVIILLSSVVSSFEFPTRQALVPTLVSRSQMANALALNSVMMQLTFIIGPTAGGLVLGWLGIANTYWFDVISYLVVLASLFVMVVPNVPVEKRAQANFGALLDGMRFLKEHPIILAVLSLDFFATFFGSPRALLPVYAQDILHT